MSDITQFPGTKFDPLRQRDGETVTDYVLRQCLGKFEEVVVIGLTESGMATVLSSLVSDTGTDSANEVAVQLMEASIEQIASGEVNVGWTEA